MQQEKQVREQAEQRREYLKVQLQTLRDALASRETELDREAQPPANRMKSIV